MKRDRIASDVSPGIAHRNAGSPPLRLPQSPGQLAFHFRNPLSATELRAQRIFSKNSEPVS